MIALTGIEQRNGMFALVDSNGAEVGYMGYGEMIQGRNAFTINLKSVKLQRCGGCDQEMAFSEREDNRTFGMYGYTHTACGHSGKLPMDEIRKRVA